MEFHDNRAIYLQIAELVCEKIIRKQWVVDDRIPSVRELAIELGVNPNTVMRTYELLQAKSIITNKRGVGYFTSTDGLNNAEQVRREEFIEIELPLVFKTASLLNIGLDEIKDLYRQYKQNLTTK